LLRGFDFFELLYYDVFHMRSFLPN